MYSEILQHLLRISNNWKFICNGGVWIHFKEDNDLIVSARTSVAEKYPDAQILTLFSAKENRQVCKFPQGLPKVLERAEIFSGTGELEGLTHVTMRNNGGNLVIESKKEAIGAFEEDMPWPENAMPDNFELILPPAFLRKILKTTRDFSANDKSILFTVGNFQYLAVARKEEKKV